MIDYIKKKWFRVPAKTNNSDSVYEAIGLSYIRMDELSEKVAYLFGVNQRTSQVAEQASMLCRNNKELLAVGMMINSVVAGFKEREEENRKRGKLLELIKKPVAVCEIENSNILHRCLGIDDERALEIGNLCEQSFKLETDSFVGMIEHVSKELKHANELVLAVQYITLNSR